MSKGLPVLDETTLSVDTVDRALAAEKMDRLRRELVPRVRQGALVAFSGGVDSAFLLWACQEADPEGGRVLALTTTSASMPSHDHDDAVSFARALGVEHVLVESRELEHPEYVLNDGERCYHCKSELFRICNEVAAKRGLRCLLYGYNASDHDDDRPGQRAATEAGVLTPLSDVGLTKPEIRFLMREAKLPLSAKPASPCLSSRIMTGIRITPERLGHVEALEDILRRAGVSTVRVRVCRSEEGSWFLRIEADPDEMVRVLDVRQDLEKAGSERGYRWITLDLGGYRLGGGTS